MRGTFKYGIKPRLWWRTAGRELAAKICPAAALLRNLSNIYTAFYSVSNYTVRHGKCFKNKRYEATVWLSSGNVHHLVNNTNIGKLNNLICSLSGSEITEIKSSYTDLFAC